MRDRFVLPFTFLVCASCSAGARPGPPSETLLQPWETLADAAISLGRGEASTPTDAGAAAAESGADAAGPCDGVTQLSLDVSEYDTVFPVPPPAGGTIVPGTYVLDEVTTYVDSNTSDPEPPPVKPTGVLLRATVHVTATSMTFVEARGTDDGDGGVFRADTVRAEAYTTSEASLLFSGLCPDPGQPSSVPYTSTAGRLVLYLSPTAYEAFRPSP